MDKLSVTLLDILRLTKKALDMGRDPADISRILGDALEAYERRALEALEEDLEK